MSFTSLPFAIFTPLFLLGYFAISAQKRPVLLALASIIFYTWYDPKYLPLLVGSAVIDYVAGRKIYAADRQRDRKTWLILSILFNLGLLFFFKYWNFFATNVQAVTGTDMVLHNLVLPLGISFYTLQTMSYTFDIYRKKLKPEESFFTYFLYVSFFPQLVAGPIERAGRLMPQIKALPMPSRDMCESGMVLVAWGVFCKLAVADNIAGFVQSALWNSEGGLLMWGVGFCATVQVYADFLAYTLIARGLGRMMGITLSENFRQPFFARNLTGFWQRWHITLTRWVTDYIHIPIARRYPQEPWRSLTAIMAMVIIGLWHGASWNFVLFGLTQGILMRVWGPISGLLGRLNGPEWLAKMTGHTAVLLTCSMSAPMFFITDTQHLIGQLGTMFSTDLGIGIIADGQYRENFVVGLGMMVFLFLNDWNAWRGNRWNIEALSEVPMARPILIGLICVAVILLGNFNTQEFIYFEF